MVSDLKGISYVIISFNSSAKVLEEIAQIQKENNCDWQCVILDNGSNDETNMVARRLVDKDLRIRYIFQQKQAIEIAKRNATAVCKFEDIYFIYLAND